SISFPTCSLAPVSCAWCSSRKRQTIHAPTVSISPVFVRSRNCTGSSYARNLRSSSPMLETSSGPCRTTVVRPPRSSTVKSAHSRMARSYADKFPWRQGVAIPRCSAPGGLAKAHPDMNAQQPGSLPKTFDPAAIEAKWYSHWEENGCFRPERPGAQPFTIVNPPPNVTGSLHIGHALDNTLQDVVVRYERLRGKDALWVVGTDHAGIATQMVVERNLASQGVKRTDMTREQFVDHVWEWKEQSGGTITRQLRRLGCSMDWSREPFTTDPHFTRAVTKVCVDLYDQGLIYRDKRLVNWDPKRKTAISDLEVETREVQGGFWRFKYPLADGVTLDSGADHIVVATTRPETMLADMAVAVHPEDQRYKPVIGKDILQPITGRRVKVVADEHADPELGSGAVKITPGHDFNDFEVGKRAGIKPAEMLNMFDAE